MDNLYVSGKSPPSSMRLPKGARSRICGRATNGRSDHVDSILRHPLVFTCHRTTELVSGRGRLRIDRRSGSLPPPSAGAPASASGACSTDDATDAGSQAETGPMKQDCRCHESHHVRTGSDGRGQFDAVGMAVQAREQPNRRHAPAARSTNTSTGAKIPSSTEGHGHAGNSQAATQGPSRPESRRGRPAAGRARRAGCG